MSLASVIPYFQTVMNELGHTEWTDAFNFENIPSTVIDRAYHLTLESGTGIKQNQNDIETQQPISVRLFVKGFRDPAEGRDRAVGYVEDVIQKALSASRRLTGGLKNVQLQNMSYQAFGDTNDNIVMATLNFNTLVLLDPD